MNDIVTRSQKRDTILSRFVGTGQWTIALVAAATLLLCSLARLVPGVTGVYHDDGIYVATSRSLAKGSGYRLINLPDAPRQTKYPPLYPLLLAPLWWLPGSLSTTVTLMQLLTLATSAIWVAVASAFLVRTGLCSRRAALVVGLLTATAPNTSFFATLVLSEMPFALALMLSLKHLQRPCGEHAGGLKDSVVTGIALATPFLVRSLGVAVPLAALALRRRRLLPALVAAGILVAPWLIWLLGAGGAFSRVPAGYYVDYTGAWMSQLRIDGVGIIVGNLVALPIRLGMTGIGALARSLVGTPFVLLLPLAGVLVLVSLAAGVRQRSMAAWVVACYLLVLVLWPWPPARFLVPLTPLIIVYLYRGANRIIPHRLLTGHVRRALLGACVVAALAGNLWDVGHASLIARQHHYPEADGGSWSDYLDLFHWIRANTAPDAVLASGLDTMLFVYTGRPSIRAFPHRPDALFYGSGRPPVGTAAELVHLLETQRVSYLVVTAMAGFAEELPFERLVREVLAHEPDRFERVYQGSDSRFTIYRVQLDRR